MSVLPAEAAHFEQFMEDRTDSLLRTAYLLTQSRHAAEELVQDSLVALYPQWSRVVQADSPIAYVRRSLINRYLSQQRRPAAGELITDFSSRPEQPSGPDFAHRVDDRDQLRRALAMLSPRQQVAVVLRYFHDLSDQEVAKTMDCSTGTVRSLISRGLGTLRENVSSLGDQPGQREVG